MTPERQAEIRDAWSRDLPKVLAGKDPMKNPIYNGIPMREWNDLPPVKNYTVEHVLKCAMRATKVSRMDLLGPRRAAPLARPRQLTYLLLRDFCPLRSLPEIARAMKKDHTTVMHGIKAARIRRDKDPDYRQLHEKAVRFIEGREDGGDVFAEAIGEGRFDG